MIPYNGGSSMNLRYSSIDGFSMIEMTSLSFAIGYLNNKLYY